MAKEHPFAKFVAALGRGPSLSRDLTQDEAVEAMRMILAGRVEPIQLGAFLMLMRYKKETPAELAGFVRAARESFGAEAPAARADLDWPSYADRHRQLPWFVPAALLLAENGIRVAMHGIAGHDEGFLPTRRVLAAFDIRPSDSMAEAEAVLEARNFAYLSLEGFCPGLGALFDLRPLMGLRSPVNSLARELNPFRAPHQLQGVFHPTYREPHAETARLLGQAHAAVFKGIGGEIQRNPFKPCEVEVLSEGRRRQEIWPPLLDGPAFNWRSEALEPERVVALWRGTIADPAPEAAVTGTAAIALKVLGRAADIDGAQALAEAMWRRRPRAKYGERAALSA